MLQLQQLEQLIAFADQGTLSKAAEVLLISQPSLTHNMQSLEDDLGVQLFQRSKNKLILTETGKYTVQQAKKLLKQRQTFLVWKMSDVFRCKQPPYLVVSVLQGSNGKYALG